jgi:uncharacterized protein with PIN domain
MPPAFAVDRTLGRLGKWLRLMGFDTLLERDNPSGFPGPEASGRVVLTRIRSRHEAFPAGRSLFITHDRAAAQREQVVRELGVRASDLRPFTRCLRCNTVIVPVGSTEVEGLVPEYVLATQESFSRCPSCSRVYWKGTHTARALEEIRRLFGG